MNKQEDNGGTAFPIPYGQVMCDEGKGMTLRDYFAAAALTGQLAKGSNYSVVARKITCWCYEIADAMIEARKQTSQ